MLGPNDAVNGLGRCVPNGASGEGLLRLLWRALVALSFAFFYELHLPVVASRSALDERHICRQTHAVHVITRLPIVQCVQHQLEILIETDPVICAEHKEKNPSNGC